MSNLLNTDGTSFDPPPLPPAPLGANGEPKKRFEVRMRQHPNGELEKAIFIGDDKLDWTIDVSSYMEACKMGMQYKLAVQDDIAKHFIKSVGEFLGRYVTIEEIKAAIKTGWI